MFITLRGPNIALGDVGAYLNHTSDGRAFAVVNLGSDAAVHVHTAEQADAGIAAFAEAKRLLSPPVITESCGVEIQAIRDDGDDCWVCTEDAGHAGDHIAKDIYCQEVHRWPAAPVITGSEPGGLLVGPFADDDEPAKATS